MWLVLRIQARTRLVPLLVAAGTTGGDVRASSAGRAGSCSRAWTGSRTYLESNARQRLLGLRQRRAVWLHDISLIVPVAILVIVVVAWATHRDEVAAQRALVLSLTSVTFMLVFSPAHGRHPPRGADVPGDAVAAGADRPRRSSRPSRMPDRRWTRLQTGAGVLAVVVVIATGHVAPGLTLLGRLAASPIVVVAVFLLAVVQGRHRRDRRPGPAPVGRAAAAELARRPRPVLPEPVQLGLQRQPDRGPHPHGGQRPGVAAVARPPATTGSCVGRRRLGGRRPRAVRRRRHAAVGREPRHARADADAGRRRPARRRSGRRSSRCTGSRWTPSCGSGRASPRRTGPRPRVLRLRLDPDPSSDFTVTAGPRLPDPADLAGLSGRRTCARVPASPSRPRSPPRSPSPSP